MKRKIFVILVLLMSPQFSWAWEFPAIHGFVGMDYGVKLSDDQTKRDNYNLLEQRLQLKANYFLEEGYWGEHGGILNLKGDFTVDEYYSGKTGFELRELNFSFVPFDFMDAKIGRQILTWGTGDYIFINDMFPKDYVSFFCGREDEYLKKPSDALKVSLYPEVVNIDFIVIPKFTPNTTAQGDRLSFFDMFQGGLAGRASDRELLEPAWQMANNEYALRMYRSFGSNEWSWYYFRGFDKNPVGIKDEAARQLYYPRVDVYGGSLRGPFAKGIGYAEMGYVNAREDSSGTNRLIENSFLKTLLGYSQDLGQDWKVGFQYYYEQRLDYKEYKESLLPTDFVFDEFRHVLTQRVTKLFKHQTVQVSLFNFYSPSDKDGYVRPSVTYDITDQWKGTVGLNIPWGEDDSTEFGQMKRNKNIYFRIKYSF